MKKFVLHFFQRLFVQPDREFYSFLTGNSLSFLDLGIEIDFETLEELQVEYTRLFVGPAGHHSPYQSVFLEGKFWGNAAVEVKRFIQQTGLKLDSNFNMPPDHISVELEILEKLVDAIDELPLPYESEITCGLKILDGHEGTEESVECGVWSAECKSEIIPKSEIRNPKSHNNQQPATSNQQSATCLYEDFLKNHISWIPDFLKTLVSKTNLNFYKTSFEFAIDFFEKELDVS